MSKAPLISAQALSKSFGIKPLFEEITLAVDETERLCLIGPNGAGKSTLLKILGGIIEPDSGSVMRRNGLRMAYVSQQDVFKESDTVGQVLSASLISVGQDEHDVHGSVSATAGQFGFTDLNQPISQLSGGWRKRLSLARAMILEPELLLLDEPTNHLDIEGVLWLEKILLRTKAALVFVSHDRYFIEKIAERVIEVSRRYPSGTFSSSGGYVDFLEAREAHLAGLFQTRESLANRVRRETAWLRQGAKARTTKSKHRSERAYEMMEELRSFRLEEEKAKLEFAASKRQTRELFKIDGISKGFEAKELFKNLNLIISPGFRLGVVGPNGSGKTTFLKVLLGELKPDAGRVVKPHNLKIAFFDQGRKTLDPDQTLKKALCNEGDAVVFQGKEIHINGWAERFLFSREQLALKVGELSGGEQARLLLARLVLAESDVLVFDEPTNDLDIDTLEVLEDSFAEYPGAIVLITHDRFLLERTATQVLGLGEDAGRIYADYLQWENRERVVRGDKAKSREEPDARAGEAKTATKLSFKEQRELDSIEESILLAEEKLSKIKDEAASEAIVSNAKALTDCYQSLAAQQAQVDALYARWEELEAKRREIEEAKRQKAGG